MSYVEARLEQEHVNETSRLYMAEGIRAISENTSGTGGLRLNSTLSELFSTKNEEPKRTAEEIITTISDGLDRLGNS